MRTFFSFLWRFILIFVTLGGMLWLMTGCGLAEDWLDPMGEHTKTTLPSPTATPR